MKCQCRHRGKVKLQLQLFGNFGARRRWVVSATLWLLYTGKRPRYTLYRRLDRPLGCCGRDEKISLLPGLDPWTIQRVASRCTSYAIPAVSLVSRYIVSTEPAASIIVIGKAVKYCYLSTILNNGIFQKTKTKVIR
jgi:hypothetical protein